MAQSVQSSNWCCWPFSLCCGEVESEKKPLLEDQQNYSAMGDGVSKRATTPGSTPTKDTTVREQRRKDAMDYV